MTLSALEIREVLCFDRFRESEYTIGQRIVIHQHLQQGATLPAYLRERLERDVKSIRDRAWEAPEMKYDDDRNLVYYCTTKNEYKLLKSLKQ